MSKKMTIAIMTVIMIGGIRAGKANILAIEEMKTELTGLTEKYSESKINLANAKNEYKNLKKAQKDLIRAIKLAIKSEESKKKAEQMSIESISYGKKRNPYLSDMGHIQGQISLSQASLEKGAKY